jgi:mannitol/fructose-specific phosphotransferase system IIA component (Ntr-type)
VISLADYTNLELLTPCLENRSASAAIAELCSRLDHAGKVQDSLSFYDAVIRREKLSSTATAYGLALPHARSDGLPELSFALGITSEPLAWFDKTPEPVRMVFLFAIPDGEVRNYLKLISGLARLSRDPVYLSRLLQAPDSQAMLQMLQQIPLREARAAAVRS